MVAQDFVGEAHDQPAAEVEVASAGQGKVVAAVDVVGELVEIDLALAPSTIPWASTRAAVATGFTDHRSSSWLGDDPERAFKIAAMNGRRGLESGLRLKASIAPGASVER